MMEHQAKHSNLELNPLIGSNREETIEKCEKALNTLSNWMMWDDSHDGSDYESIGLMVQTAVKALGYAKDQQT